MKTAFIIPGLGESEENNPAYSKIVGYFKAKGIKSLIVPIKWRYTTISDNMRQFEEFYAKHKFQDPIFLGFSLGAMVAFMSAGKLDAKTLILCSLSPYFKNDLANTRKVLSEKIIKRYIGERRMKDHKNYDFNQFTSGIKMKTFLLCGDQEGPLIYRKVKEAKEKIKDIELIEIKGAKHDISRESYLKAIHELINREF